MSTKSIQRTVTRLQEKYSINDEDAIIMEHMLRSIVISRDRRIKYLTNRVTSLSNDWMPTQRKIVGSLRSCIREHGPITKDCIEIAAKRKLNNMVDTPIFAA